LETFHRVDADMSHHWGVRLLSAPPPEASGALADAAQNLVSALDYLLHELVWANGSTHGRRHYFPFAKDAQSFESTLASKADGVSSGALDALRDVEPFEHGAGDDLWRLYEMNRVERHSIPVAVTLLSDAVVINMSAGFDPSLNSPPMDVALRAAEPETLAVGEETVFFSDVSEQAGAYDYNPRAIVRFTFDGKGLFGCEEVLPRMSQLLQRARDTVEPFRTLLARPPGP
jgi:hypothetical protein